MAKHQIIYTSCMRGIDGVNDGQQIFSYDATFADSKSDDVKSLFTYQVPSLLPGVIMTEELALTMPAAFSYRLLKNSRSSITLNTYLGRDYMGSAGRFGNHLSHSVICDFHEMTVYPCEIYGSSTLRGSMEFSEVNNPEPPKHLPEAQIEKGYKVDPDSISEFLGIGDNLEYYKKMLCAMLKFQEEKKRVVICDETENIVMWIAALEYALPLDIAKKVDFTTYEFDPELSPAQICGVITEGSRYNAGAYVSSGRHYVFDFINSSFNEIEADNSFVEFLDTAFSFSYDSLVEFKDFVMNSTTYREANEEYYAAYDLYNFLSNGIFEISMEQFNKIIDFTNKYTTEAIKRELIRKIVEESEAINALENNYALKVLGFLMNSMEKVASSQQDAIKQLIVDRLIISLSNPSSSENEFLQLYKDIDCLAKTIGLSIPAELLKDNNRASLVNDMYQGSAMWKLHFIIGLISAYVKETRLPIDQLHTKRPIGYLYFEIIKAVYATGRQKGFEIVEKIIDNFKDNGKYLVNMFWNMQEIFDVLSLEEMDREHLWNYFTKTVLGLEGAAINSINVAFAEYERFEEMFYLYKARVEAEKDFHVKREIFKDTFENWFNKSRTYKMEFSERVLQVYESAYKENTNSMSSEMCFKYAKEILHIAMQMNTKAEYIDWLILAITDFIPLERPSGENEKILTEMRTYQFSTRGKKVAGRLLLFCIGMDLDKLISGIDVSKVAEDILLYADVEGANTAALSEKSADNYLEWVLTNPLKYSLSTDAYTKLFQLFKMSKRSERMFMEQCCKASYQKSKDAKAYEAFSEFLVFMFTYGNSDDIENTGKYLCKLSKKGLEELDVEMKELFKRDRKSTHKWDEIREIAESTNPLLNNLSGLFKRKKD